jgi:uncharacterized protein YjeT (DUF2065 family)
MTGNADPHAVRLARLLASAPETVLEDLRRSAAGRRSRLSTHLDEELEAALAARHEPLIDLALAQYGSSSKVVAALFTESLKKGAAEADEQRRRGLRVACYANEQLDLFLSEGLLSNLAATPTVAAKIVSTAPLDEMSVLLRNPAVGDKTLSSLYAGTRPFQGLEEDRWARLVELAADNPRIVTDEDDQHGPDWGFWDIHKALFQLVRTAPLTDRWCRALHRTVANIHPPSVAITEDIGPTLERWDLDLKRYDGDVLEGDYTGLPFAEEFRCMLAAVYGTRFVDSRYVHSGSASSPTLGERCAYYGGAKLTKKEVERFAAADGAAFGLAVAFNERAILENETRAAIEEHADLPIELYRSRVAVIAQKWRYLRQVVARWHVEDDDGLDQLGSDAAIRRLEQQVTALSTQVRNAGYVIIAVAVLIVFFLRR